MRWIVIPLALLGAFLVALKLKVHERLMARCEAMFERMPHSAPGSKPKLHERVMKQCEAMFQQKRATPTAQKASDVLEEGDATAAADTY